MTFIMGFLKGLLGFVVGMQGIGGLHEAHRGYSAGTQGVALPAGTRSVGILQDAAQGAAQLHSIPLWRRPPPVWILGTPQGVPAQVLLTGITAQNSTVDPQGLPVGVGFA